MIYLVRTIEKVFLTTSERSFLSYKECYPESRELTTEEQALLDINLLDVSDYSISYDNDILNISLGLASQKKLKIMQLNSLYELAQVVKFENSITFYLGLKRTTGLDDIRVAVSKAQQDGIALVQVTAIDNQVYKTLCIYPILKKIQDLIDLPVSQTNWAEYDFITKLINKVTTQAELEAIRQPNLINNTVININQICEEIYNNISTSIQNKQWLEEKRTIVNNEAHYNIFTLVE
jgi:hypothetical protein